MACSEHNKPLPGRTACIERNTRTEHKEYTVCKPLQLERMPYTARRQRTVNVDTYTGRTACIEHNTSIEHKEYTVCKPLQLERMAYTARRQRTVDVDTYTGRTARKRHKVDASTVRTGRIVRTARIARWPNKVDARLDRTEHTGRRLHKVDARTVCIGRKAHTADARTRRRAAGRVRTG